MDTLNIKALKVATKIGVHAWEQRINQQLLIDISIPSDFRDCQDKIENTLDYAAICQLITEYVESNSFKLIETVAEHVASLIKEKFKMDHLTVAVTKPNAVKNAGLIQVSISR